MGRKLSAFLIAYIMLSSLIASTYFARQNIQQQKIEPQKTVYIYGDTQLSRAFAKIFKAMGYKVIILQDTQQKQKPTIKIRADTKPPQVEITNPANNSYVSGNTSLTILASDNVSVDTVILYIDGQQKQTWSGAGTYTYYWDTTTYTDGQHTVQVWANDTSGNTNSTTWKYTVDNTAPTVTIQSPTQGAYLGSSDVTVTWTGNDNIQIDHYEISLDGQSPVNVGTQTSHTFSGVGDGDHNVTVYVYDKAGNVDFDIVYFTVDTSSPVVTIINPASGEWFNIENVTVSWTANDTGSGIDYYEIRIDSGAWINIGLNTSYTFTNLSEGSHTVDVRAYDKAGNSGIDSITFGVDLTEPTVTITSPSDGDYVNTSDVDVEWVGNELISSIDHYEVRCKNSTWDSGWINVGTATSYTFSNLADGQYTIYVKAIDLAGNVGVDSIEITVDTVAPSVIITDPANNSVVGGPSVSIDVTSSDLHPDKTWLTINGSVVQTWVGDGSFSYSWDTTGYSDGVYEIVAYANDTAGNIGSYRILVTIDNTAPTVTITDPANNSVVGGPSVSIDVTSSDLHPDKTWLTINGSVVQTWVGDGSFSYSWDTTGYSDGVYEIVAYANDTVGNVGSYRILVTVDNTAPTVTITDPANNSVVGGPSVSIDVTSSDLHPDKTWLTINGSVVQTWVGDGSFSYSWDTTGYSDGVYEIVAYANDTVGNVGSYRILVTVDNTAPTVTITDPANNSVVGGPSVSIDVTSSDLHPDKTWLTINGSVVQTWVGDGSFSYSWDTTGYSDGVYEIVAYANDTVGNVGSYRILVTVDNTAPTVTITDPANNSVVGGPSVSIDVTSSDLHPDKTWLTINGSVVQTWVGDGSFSYSWDTTGYSDGVYEIVAYANDTVGNVGSYRILVTVDNTAPTVTITDPANNSVVGGPSVSIDVTSSDLHPDKTWLTINGSVVQTWVGDGSFSYSWDTTGYSDGVYEIVAYANDTVGNVGSYRILVTVDNTGPDVYIVSPSDGAYVNGVVAIIFNASDPNNVSLVELYIDGNLRYSNNTEVQSATYTWDWDTSTEPEGNHTINVTAYDVVGNANSVEITVCVDRTPPSITITSPANNTEFTSSGDVTIQWTASDDNELDKFEVYLNGSLKATLPGDARNYTFYKLSNGGYNATVVAYDKAGNTDSDYVVFTVNVPYSVTIEQPANDTWTNESLILIQINYVNQTSTVMNITLYINDVKEAYWEKGVNLTRPIQYNYSIPSEGLYNITAVMKDDIGQVATDTVWIHVDWTPPTVTIDSPADGSYVSGVVDVNVTANDANFDRSELFIGGTSVVNWTTPGTNTYSWDTTTYADGVYVIEARAWDLAGNMDSAQITVTVDNTPPTVTIDSPADGSYVSGVVDVNVTANDANFDRSELFIGGTSVVNWTTPGTNTYSWDTTTYADGVYVIEARAWDLAGNMDSAQITVTVDNTPPTVTIDSPADGSYVSGVVDVNVTANDANFDRSELFIGGTSVVNWTTPGTNTYSWDTTTYADGVYVIEARAWDLAGNMDSAQITVTVDNTPPTVTIDSPADGSYVSGVVDVNVTANDANFDRSELFIGGTSVVNWTTPGTNTYSWDTTTYADGVYVIEARAWDLAGNMDSAQITVTVDNTPPTVSITSPSNNSNVGTTFTVYWDAQDDTSYIKIVKVYLNNTLEATYVYGDNMTDHHTFTGLSAPALYNVTVEVFDAVDLSDLDTIWVHTVQLSVQITSPPYGYVTNKSWVNVTWTATGDIDHFEIYRNGTLLNGSIPANVSSYNVTLQNTDNAWNITVIAVSTTGSTASSSVIVYTDFTKPLIEFMNPQDGAYVCGIVNVVVNVTDEHFNMSELYIDGTNVQNWTTSGVSTYSWDTTLYLDGLHTLTVKAYDDAGNSATSSITVIVDNTVPIVTIDSPLNESIVGGIVDIVVTTVEENLDRTELLINGTSMVNWTVNGTNTYEWDTLGYNETTYLIVAMATDLAGNTNTTSIIVTVDNTPPTISIDNPGDGEYLRGIVEINITANDTHFEKVELYIDGNLVASWNTAGTHTYSWNTSRTYDGSHTINATAFDQAGNTNSVKIAVYVDNTPPSVSFDAPTNNSYVKGLVDIVVRANDNMALKNVTLYINGSLEDQWNETGQHTYTWDTTSISDGLYELIAVAYDMSGNMASTYIYVTVDNTPPDVTITKPTSGTWLNISDVNVSWTGSDDTSGIDHYEVRRDGGSWTDVGSSTWHIFSGLSEGTHTVDIQAFDKAGNTRMASVTFGVDLTPPTVTIVDINPSALVGGYVYTTPTFTLTFNYSDNLSNIVLAETYINGTLNKSQSLGQMSGSSTVTISGLNVSQYYNVSVYVYDEAGWVGVDYVIVYITQFGVSITYPVNGTYINTTYVFVQWKFFPTGVGKDVNNVRIFVDRGMIYNTSENITSYNVTGLSPNAWHNITVFAMDKSGNTATDTVFIYIDTLAPNLWFVSISPSYCNMTIGMNVTTVGGVITWSASDNTGIAYYMLSVDGGAWVNIGLNTTYIVTDALSEGYHSLSVKAVDFAKNFTVATLDFMVDNSPPSVEVEILDTPYITDGYYNVSQLTIRITVSDKYSDYNGTILIYINNVLRNKTSELTYVTPTLANGGYNLTVVVFDMFNYTAKAEVLFYIDTEDPAITLTKPTEGGVIAETTVRAEWSVSDSYSGIWKVEIKLDNNEWKDVTNVTSYDFTNVESGDHTIYIRAIDRAGNIGSDSVSFSIVIKPSVQFDLSGWLVVPYYFNTTTISLIINVTAYTSYTLSVYINGTLNWSSSHTQSVTNKVVNITVDEEGVYNISVEVSDAYGNKVVDSKLVYVDITAPSLAISAPSPGATITTDTIEIRGTVSDNLSGVYKVYMRLDKGSWREASLYENGTFAYAFADLSEKTHSVDIKALDKAGNVQRTGLSFVVTVTTTAPIRPPIEIMLAILLAVMIAVVVVLKRKKKAVVPEESEAAEALREVAEAI